MKRTISILILTVTVLFLLGSDGWCDDKKIVDFQGIGIVVRRDSGNILVDGIFKGSPAQDKLQIGDQITEVYGESTKYMTIADLMQKIDKPPGIPVKMMIYRDKKLMSVSIVSDTFPVVPDTVPENNRNLNNPRILGFQSRDFLDVRFPKEASVEKGDTFFIFFENNLLGLARIRHVSGQQASMKIIQSFDDIPSHRASRYNLMYYCYLSEVFRIEPHDATAPVASGDSLLRVRIKNYSIFKTNTGDIRILATIENIGNTTASEVIVGLGITDDVGVRYGVESVKARNLKPGSENILDIPVNLTVPDGFAPHTDGMSLSLNAVEEGRKNRTLKLGFEVKSYSLEGDIYIFRESY